MKRPQREINHSEAIEPIRSKLAVMNSEESLGENYLKMEPAE